MKVLAKVNKRAWPYLFILPWIIGFLVFTLGPLVLSFVMSFFDWSITGTPKFRGLGNYIEMFTTDDQVLKSLSISLKYAAIFVPLNMIIALVLAMLISQPVKGAKFFRTIFYIPAVISGVAVSIIFGWLLNGNYGVINYLLSLLGIDTPTPMTGQDLNDANALRPGRALMQYDGNFALMSGESVVILQPGQPASHFIYSPENGMRQRAAQLTQTVR